MNFDFLWGYLGIVFILQARRFKVDLQYSLNSNQVWTSSRCELPVLAQKAFLSKRIPVIEGIERAAVKTNKNASIIFIQCADFSFASLCDQKSTQCIDGVKQTDTDLRITVIAPNLGRETSFLRKKIEETRWDNLQKILYYDNNNNNNNNNQMNNYFTSTLLTKNDMVNQAKAEISNNIRSYVRTYNPGVGCVQRSTTVSRVQQTQSRVLNLPGYTNQPK
eukprot:TRINITY_DN20_c0_g1_i1.p1 TRINITY_DN20_c0_g1~~TRINITY_DN20_c0_g1_i1.p1  ORF type:complete len:220 (-),score=6.62 TRINITY_DN20_c0_g1_i1:248-907(-)